MNPGIEITGVLRSGLVPFSLVHCREAPEELQRIGIPAALGEGARAVSFAALYDHAQPPLVSRWVTLEAADGSYAASLPREEVLDFGWIVYELDGGELPPEEGGPFRLVMLDYRDPCANIRDLGRVEFATAPGRDTRPSLAKPDACDAPGHGTPEDG